MIYISAGMEKSGSTLTYNLTKLILEAAGFPHIQLSPEDRNDVRQAKHANNIRKFTPDVVANVEAAAAAHAGQVITLRTHGLPSPKIKAVIRQGRAVHHVCIRDPRDVALSFIDLARRQHLVGNRTEAGSDSLQSTFPFVLRGIRTAVAWCEIPGAVVLRYEETAFTPRITTAAICAQLKLGLREADCDVIFGQAAGMKNNKLNVGESLRHRREMSEEDQALVMKTFPAFYERYFPDAVIAVETPITQAERAARNAATEHRLAKAADRRRLKAALLEAVGARDRTKTAPFE